ncbi:MAG: RNA-guided pseudouridylation complex pseudouridine synthase subunit Cbf5 [Desulfurococcaceae archaeon]|nr:RNA-guided pseudouridylation complex pseudouridine synthase subunit Cbf5 [Desulfurococcaceae archaeon]
MTGVLPVGLANSTKVIGSVIHSVKEYVMLIQLHEYTPLGNIQRAIENFKGKIYQKPPLRSSVKRTVRVKTIYEIEILDHYEKYVLMRVLCDPGTYMRKLAHDLGLILGVGAHMRELRRTRTGPFREDETLVRLQTISEALYLWRTNGREDLLRRYVLPVEVSVVHLPKIVIMDTAVDAIAHGADLAVPGVVMLTSDVKANNRVAIFTLKGELVALGRALRDAEEIAKMEKGIVVKTTRVIMPRGVYPDYWKRRKTSTVLSK